MYFLVLDRLGTYWFQAFLHTTFNAPPSVFAAALWSRFSFQSAGRSKGKTMAHELMTMTDSESNIESESESKYAQAAQRQLSRV